MWGLDNFKLVTNETGGNRNVIPGIKIPISWTAKKLMKVFKVRTHQDQSYIMKKLYFMQLVFGRLMKREESEPF